MVELGSWDGFETGEIETGETSIFARWSGSGPPILLLHGFPQTHLMWRGVAPLLAGRFTVVCADLRGYGRSGCPPSTPDHGPYSKRAMARDMVLDILPTGAVWERADARFALAYWPWSLLAQPEPTPERLITAAPEVIVDDALSGWGSPSTGFGPEVRTAYVEALRDPGHVHAICEEYRAAATVDRSHDDEDRKRGRRMACPVLVLWSDRGPLSTWYTEAGGPLALWRAWADDVQGHALPAGHFFPEEAPTVTADALARFWATW
jgi:haloacetate dehalogenase